MGGKAKESRLHYSTDARQKERDTHEGQSGICSITSTAAAQPPFSTLRWVEA
jgi:hypothetical protein